MEFIVRFEYNSLFIEVIHSIIRMNKKTLFKKKKSRTLDIKYNFGEQGYEYER